MCTCVCECVRIGACVHCFWFFFCFMWCGCLCVWLGAPLPLWLFLHVCLRVKQAKFTVPQQRLAALVSMMLPPSCCRLELVRNPKIHLLFTAHLTVWNKTCRIQPNAASRCAPSFSTNCLAKRAFGQKVAHVMCAGHYPCQARRPLFNTKDGES